MKNVNIPEPCSENWNEMTPSEKGAFCQKCALDVYDFTNKSGDEIRDILTLNIGSRVCGRIEPQQLVELNHDFSAWKINNSRSFQRAWVFTLFVVFGMTLFSCEEDDEPVMGKIQQKAKVIFAGDTYKVTPVIEVDTIPLKTAEKKNTQVISGPVPPFPDELEILGEIDYYPEVIVPEEDSIVVVDMPEPMMKGAMISTHVYTEYLHENARAECSKDECTRIPKSGS